jgi:hypothetical protein
MLALGGRLRCTSACALLEGSGGVRNLYFFAGAAVFLADLLCLELVEALAAKGKTVEIDNSCKSLDARLACHTAFALLSDLLHMTKV